MPSGGCTGCRKRLGEDDLQLLRRSVLGLSGSRAQSLMLDSYHESGVVWGVDGWVGGWVVVVAPSRM